MTSLVATRLRSARQTGFSLIEILIVVVLIGGIMTLVANQIFNARDRANVNLARTQVQTVGAKVESFQMDVGSLPGSLSDLIRQPSGANGWLGPYAKKESDIKDPWGREFQYSVDGSAGAGFTLDSMGKDGKPGGQSFDADIKYGE
jgi:general secretion pathway protein G